MNYTFIGKKRGTFTFIFTITLLSLFISFYLLAAAQEPSSNINEKNDTFNISDGVIDYSYYPPDSNQGNNDPFSPVTQQDYVLVQFKKIFISRYERNKLDLGFKNDVVFTFSIKNGKEGDPLYVHKTDIVENLRSGRFLPIFNSLIMPIEILKGDTLVLKIEGYKLYSRKKAKFKLISDTLLGASLPYIGPYGEPAKLALDSFNKLVSLKQDDKIFNFQITFNVPANFQALDLYKKGYNENKLSSQTLLRPQKYPLINTNDPYVLTLKKDAIKKTSSIFKGMYVRHMKKNYNEDNSDCAQSAAESLMVKNDTLFIRCDKKENQDNKNYEPVTDHSYVIIQISPWIRDFCKERFYEPLNELRAKWSFNKTVSSDSAQEKIELSRGMLSTSPLYNELTKQAYRNYLYPYLENFYRYMDISNVTKYDYNEFKQKIDVMNECLKLRSLLTTLETIEPTDYNCLSLKPWNLVIFNKFIGVQITDRDRSLNSYIGNNIMLLNYYLDTIVKITENTQPKNESIDEIKSNKITAYLGEGNIDWLKLILQYYNNELVKPWYIAPYYFGPDQQSTVP